MMNGAAWRDVDNLMMFSSLKFWNWSESETNGSTNGSTNVRMFRKERPLFYVRAFFSSHFQGRSLPQIPSGFPSPIQPKNNPISQVPIPRNPEELVTIALTSILATGGSIPEGNRMESWFQKGDPSGSPSRPMVPTTDHISYEWRMRWQSIPTLSTVPLVTIGYGIVLTGYYLFHEHARPILLLSGWWYNSRHPQYDILDDRRGGIGVHHFRIISALLFNNTTRTRTGNNNNNIHHETTPLLSLLLLLVMNLSIPSLFSYLSTTIMLIHHTMHR